MNSSSLHILAQLFSQRMLNTAPEGILLAALVWLLLRLVGRSNAGRQNSATRFAVWFSALAAIIALPVFASPALPAHCAAVHWLSSAPIKLHPEITLSASWAFYLFIGWAIGSGVLLLRLCVALWQVYRLQRNSWQPQLAALDPAVAELLQDFTSRRQTKLCLSSQISAPAVVGFFRPAIILPAWLLPQLSAAELEIILLHELAHLRRRDHWTNLAQKIAAALFFFHPAVWWIDSRLTLEREMACDDLVLLQTASPRAYASFLISFAEKLHDARGLELAQALVSRMRQISARITQILDAKRPGHTEFWKPAIGVTAGLLAAVVAAAPYAPRLVSVQSQPRRSQSRQLQSTVQSAPPATMASAPIPAAQELIRALPPLAARKVALAPQPAAVLAGFNPRAAALPPNFNATPQPKPMAIRAKAVRHEPAVQTFVILQAQGYDSSGAELWTLCIWRVEGGKKLTERQLQSAIALYL